LIRLRTLTVLTSTAVVALVLMLPVPLLAQEGLSPEQIRVLQQMTPAQRQALIESLSTGSVSLGPIDEQEAEAETPARTEEMEEIEEIPRLAPADSLIVDIQIPLLLEPFKRSDLATVVESDVRLQRVVGSHTYRLDRAGVLRLSGIGDIPLAGLTVEEAAGRIRAEGPLRDFDINVILLPLAPVGGDALEPFGYGLFEDVEASFEPATDMPVPANYIIGPGDTVRVQLFGNQNVQYELQINRDGTLSFPQIGPIAVAGMSFSEMRTALEARIEEQMIGVRASITMGELRSISVFVTGDVTRPGSFTVSGLSTITNALFMSGGVRASGSLRRIQLKRSGRLVQELDLYDLLLAGDNRGDARVQAYDVIFVPPVGPRAGVAGEVKRPAIYELRGETSVDELIKLAGGLLPTAFPGEVRINRVAAGRSRGALTLDLTTQDGLRARVMDGDTLIIDPVTDQLEAAVALRGHVYRPGRFQWRPGMRLTDLLTNSNELRPGADRGYILIRREVEPSGPIEVRSVDLVAALADPGGPADTELQERDTVLVFDLDAGRSVLLDPLMEELNLQSTHRSPRMEVGIGGLVRAPGTYPLEPGMTVSDLIRAGGNLLDSAYTVAAELTRYEVNDETGRVTRLISVDLRQVLSGGASADLELQAFDYLNIKEVSLWRDEATVEILGEVRFPGVYSIEPGETLSSVLERAGGVTELAFPEGGIFLREDLRERESEELERLANRIEADLGVLALQASRFEPNLAQSFGVGQSLLTQIRRAEPTGRLVINLPAIIAGRDGEYTDLALEAGDELLIPGRTQSVTVLGEVQHSTSHLFDPRLRRNEYINLSGGLTVNGDDDRIYIVRANGAVLAGRQGSKWYRRGRANDIRPGDTIVVPLDVDRIPKLALWQSATSILYNLAIAAAAVGSL